MTTQRLHLPFLFSGRLARPAWTGLRTRSDQRELGDPGHGRFAALTWSSAVAAGRCRQSTTFGSLTVDGLGLADQFAGRRLVDAGLITSQDGPTVLTESGRTLLAAA